MMRFLVLTFLMSLFTPSDPPNVEKVYEPIVVLELFTSQGCSSCPSADKLLDEVNDAYHDQNVFSLSYHVAYWNYIGWKDPYSDTKHADKQRVYARKFRSRSIYTPQLVVNGKEHFVGSDRNTMFSKVKQYSKEPVSNSALIKEVRRTGEQLDFQYEVEGALSGKMIHIALVLKERQTQVKRGENRNRNLKNTNIVIAEQFKAAASGTIGSSIAIPELVSEKDQLQLIVLVEDENSTITGAAKSTYL